MERDDETGFIYIGARYYCPWLARWLAPDPINNEWYNLCKGVPQRSQERDFLEFTASSYEYCYANPVRFTDPSGEQVPQKKIEYTKGATATTTTHANPTPANQSQSGNKATSPEFEKSAYFMLGAANAYITNLMFGLLRSSPESISGPYRIDFARGQLAGDMTSMTTGHTMTTGGLAGGVITSETGVGALAGAGIAAWGEGVSASGAIHAAITTSYILNYSGNDVSSTSDSGGSENSSSAVNSPAETPQDPRNELEQKVEELIYNPTAKHEKGGWGTVMDLDKATSQKVLNESIQGTGKQRYSYFEGKIYKFQPDNVGGYHGYPATGRDVPNDVLRQMRDNKDISNAEYNQFRKGN